MRLRNLAPSVGVLVRFLASYNTTLRSITLADAFLAAEEDWRALFDCMRRLPCLEDLNLARLVLTFTLERMKLAEDDSGEWKTVQGGMAKRSSCVISAS